MTSAVQFLAPPPGLAPFTSFALDQVEGDASLFALRALEDESVRLFLVDPAHVVPGYSPVLTEEQSTGLGLTSADDALVFVVARMTEEGVGVNLLAPVVVNRQTGAAEQLIMDGQDLPVRAILR